MNETLSPLEARRAAPWAAAAPGYYRFPTIHGDTVVFVAEDDLWSVHLSGGAARRLTSNLGEVSHPALSPDGSLLAFVGREEGGAEVYLMAAAGGPARRMTYLGAHVRVLGWTPDGAKIVFASNARQPFLRQFALFTVDAHPADPANGNPIEELPFGPAHAVSFGPGGRAVLGRFTAEPANWKRYRGGTAGQLWIDAQGDGAFSRFLAGLGGNIACPLWVGAGDAARIYFVSDHEGVGNLYSSRTDGSDLRRHTDHADFYVRNPAGDGQRIVYHAGADLYVFTFASGASRRLDVVFAGPRVQRNRKFTDAARFLDGARLHPTGRALAVTTRGKAFGFYNHDGPVIQYGKRSGVRYRLPEWLNDGQHMLLVSDEPGEECIEIHAPSPDDRLRRIEGLDIGRPVALKVSPTEDKIAISNHRHELLVVDVSADFQGDSPASRVTLVDRSAFRPIMGMDWSPDGRWIAYACSQSAQTTAIRLYRLADGAAPARAAAHPNPITITRPVLHDVRPAFDPDGNYLYFLSYREFNPVHDALHFDLGFPWGMRPYLITLRADVPNPLVAHPELEEDDDAHDKHGDEDDEDADCDSEDNEDSEDSEDAEESGGGEGNDDAWEDDADAQDDGGSDEEPGDEDEVEGDDPYSRRPFSTTAAGEPPARRGAAALRRPARAQGKPHGKHKRVRIDLDGIENRIAAFPVTDARYGQIAGIPGKVLFTSFEAHGALDHDDDENAPQSGSLRCFTFKDLKTETLAENVAWFEISRNRKKLLYASGRRLRVINAGDKAPGESGGPRKSGWLDLQRVKVSVDPQTEWEQMLREAWRLQRDHFWTEDMSQVDWAGVYRRYFPLIARVSSRSEFSDLLWEMQGELGTSHAYEWGGDYRAQPHFNQGFLGATFTWDPAAHGYRVGDIVVGDPWDPEASSPLVGPGIDVRPGDLLLAVNGQLLDEQTGPAQLLVNHAGQDVLLTFQARPHGSRTGRALPAAAQDGGQNGDAADGHAGGAAAPGAGSTAPSVGAASTESQGAGAQDGSQDDEHNGGQPDAHSTRSAVVRAISAETPARYRAWVEGNRRRVHELSQGRAGYVHIPDMGATGYAEFHRGFLAEVDRDALIVDVRFNGGGDVSQLILEKLARRRVGYDISRWGGTMPYPTESAAGPLVALTNEAAGSDGDIFCHTFKLLKLGPLIGKRTWGGVVGINPRTALVDGTVTTQPEFSFWFEDVGWGVENYGTEPDIEVDITPHDYAAGRDPQLERAVQEALAQIAQRPVLKPDLSTRPSRALPTLPARPANGRQPGE